MKDILMWPSTVVTDISTKSDVLPVVAALGASLYFIGLPSADMDFYQLGYWYVVTGVMVTGATGKLLVG